LERLLYFVETRWEGNPKVLKAVINKLAFISVRNGMQLALQRYGPKGQEQRGIDSWEGVMLFIDYHKKVKFSHPGALRKEGGS
jgi:hypothetical protein